MLSVFVFDQMDRNSSWPNSSWCRPPFHRNPSSLFEGTSDRKMPLPLYVLALCTEPIRTACRTNYLFSFVSGFVCVFASPPCFAIRDDVLYMTESVILFCCCFFICNKLRNLYMDIISIDSIIEIRPKQTIIRIK